MRKENKAHTKTAPVYAVKNQNGWLKKTEIFNTANSQHFFAITLGIGPWVIG